MYKRQHQRRYRVVSYKAAEEKHGELCSYRVSLVVKIKEQREEQALFTFIQSLPDLVLTEMEDVYKRQRERSASPR